MGHSEAATTDIRRVLRAVRPVVVLGGFVLVWWCLMTGAAQADTKVQHTLETAKPVAGHVESGRQAAHHHVDRALSTSKATVRNSPAAPIARAATTRVRTQVAEVVETTRSAVDAAPVAPKLSAPKKAPKVEQSVGESPTVQGETRSPQAKSHAKSQAKSQRMAALSSGMSADATEGLADPAETPSAGADRAAPSSPAGEGFGSTTRTGSASSSASGQPGSGSGAGAGVTENGLRLSAPTTHTSSTSLAVRCSAGPTYPPGSSPD